MFYIKKKHKQISECDGAAQPASAASAMTTAADIPGMGNAVPPGSGSAGSGDRWDNSTSAKPRPLTVKFIRKKKKK